MVEVDHSQRAIIEVAFIFRLCYFVKLSDDVLTTPRSSASRAKMSTRSLPAASLRTGDRLPAGRVFLWVFKYLILSALSSICWSICGAQSIFLPALREAPGGGGRGRRAASSARFVGVLAL